MCAWLQLTYVTSVFFQHHRKRFPPDTLSAYFRIIYTTAWLIRADSSFTCFKKYTLYRVMSFYCIITKRDICRRTRCLHGSCSYRSVTNKTYKHLNLWFVRIKHVKLCIPVKVDKTETEDQATENAGDKRGEWLYLKKSSSYWVLPFLLHIYTRQFQKEILLKKRIKRL